VATVQSRLDYANSLLYGTSSSNIHKLQRVQDTLSHLVNNQSNISSAEWLYNLNWLPNHLRINCKLVLLTYQTITLHQPSYLSSFLAPHLNSRSLHSSDQNLLHQLKVHTVTGSRAFNSSTPKIWNFLLSPIRASSFINTLKHQIKLIFLISFSVGHSPILITARASDSTYR
jgi:hypothetical protein